MHSLQDVVVAVVAGHCSSGGNKLAERCTSWHDVVLWLRFGSAVSLHWVARWLCLWQPAAARGAFSAAVTSFKLLRLLLPAC
jgi:hypothetical protein